MSKDPTSEIRKAVVQTILPKKSALRQSVEKEYAEKEKQIATDEANNLVEVREPAQLPEEASAFVNASLPAPAADTEFVNPSASASPERSVATQAPVVTQLSAPAIPGVADTTGQADAIFGGYQKEAQVINSDLQKIEQEKAQAIQAKIDEDEKLATKIEPKTFFEGKSTWQKILGGVGMFLGSMTPEGAKNVASIIENEINRDIDIQKTNIQLKQQKSDTHYKRLLEKYGSQEAALLAKKKGAYDLLDLQMKKLELNARNQETRARITMGREELTLKRQQLANELHIATAKQQQELAKGMVPGFEGINHNPSVVKEVAERVAASKSAFSSIAELEKLLKSGATMPFSSKKEMASQIRDKLAADIAKTMAGGKYSDFEYETALGLIPDITSLTQSKGVDEKLFASLKRRITADVQTFATANGYSPRKVSGAREIQ